MQQADRELAASAVALANAQQDVLSALRAGFWDLLVAVSNMIGQLVEAGDHEAATELMAERAAVIDRVCEAICPPDRLN